MNIVLRRNESDSKLIGISEANFGANASALTFRRTSNGLPSENHWYFRCVGRSGSDLVGLEIQSGQLNSIELAIFKHDQSLFDVSRFMPKEHVDFNFFLSLEPACTNNFSGLLRNGVDVKINPSVARMDNRILLGLDFEKTRKACRDLDGVTYFIDDRMILTGIGLSIDEFERV